MLIIDQLCAPGTTRVRRTRPGRRGRTTGRGTVTEWIGAAEAAERLGIKPASLYAYVSRGVLAGGGTRAGGRSLFDADEIARLARKGRPAPPGRRPS